MPHPPPTPMQEARPTRYSSSSHLPVIAKFKDASLTCMHLYTPQVTAAAQTRCVRELSSYVRVVCMRLGFDRHIQVSSP